MLYEYFKQCLSAVYTTVENSGDFSVQKTGNTLRIFFKWSDGKEDWKHNFQFLAIPKKPYKNMNTSWFCHRGCLKVWKAIEPYLVEYINDSEIENIDLVGYSHGGPLALLCYEYCIFHRPDCSIQGIGFGCPRVLWGIVPKSVKARFRNFYVIRNGADIVTHVPPALFGYSHVSPVVSVGKYKPIEFVKELFSKKPSKESFKTFFLKLFGVVDHYDAEYLKNLK